MVVLRDQTFPANGAELSFDFFRPDVDAALPVVVFLHGGGWISGDKTMYREEAFWLCNQGFACACPTYRLAPLYPFPTPVADCQRFVAYLRENASNLQIDPERITVMGNSAGGHLALMSGVCGELLDDGSPFLPANAVVSVCGISDLRDPGQSQYAISMSFIEQFMDGPYLGNEDKWAAASPASYVTGSSARVLLLHGTADDVVPIDQSRNLAKALEAHGSDCRLYELPGEGHSFSMDGWGTIREKYLQFLTA